MTLIAFYDASSHEKAIDKPLVVAGIVAREEQWTEFNHAWNRTLDLFGVSHFHMSKLAHFRGEFKSWRKNEARRRFFLIDLIEILRRTVLFGQVVRIVPDDYIAVNKVYHLDQDHWNGTYSYTALLCTAAIEQWQRTLYPDTRIRHVLEHGDTGQGVIAKLATKMGESSPLTIKAKRDNKTGTWCRPFEGCDFLAYESRLYVSDKIAGKRQRHRRSFGALIQSLPVEAGFLDKKGLTRMCETNPTTFPTRDAGG